MSLASATFIRRATFVASTVLVWAVAAHPAGQQSEPTFEVASIKENKSGDNRIAMNVVGGRLIAINMPLETLVPPSSISDSAAPIAVPAPVTVAAVLAAIVVDAASAAGEYLRDTEVPHGGE